MWQYQPYIKHYASEYYDPQKAHEYYEQHKKLKGRTSRSTARLTDTGKAAASYVKEQIDTEKNAKLEAETKRVTEEKKQRSEQKKKTIEQHTKVLSQRINSLKEALKRMTPAQKATEGPRIKSVIYKLKEENKKKRVEIEVNHIKAQYQSSYDSAVKKQEIRDEASSKYETELAEIRNNYTAPKKTKKSTK